MGTITCFSKANTTDGFYQQHIHAIHATAVFYTHAPLQRFPINPRHQPSIVTKSSSSTKVMPRVPEDEYNSHVQRIARIIRELRQPPHAAPSEHRGSQQSESYGDLLTGVDWNTVTIASDYEQSPFGGALAETRAHESIDRIHRGITPEQARIILLWCMRHFEPLLVTGSDQILSEACPACREQYGRDFARMPVHIVGVNGCSNHVFCYECIITSVTSSGENANKCPLCRAQLVETRDGRLVMPAEEDIALGEEAGVDALPR